MRIAARLLTPALVTVICVGAAAGPAHASPDRPTSATVHDGRHDVWRIIDRPDAPSLRTRVPSRRVGDITEVRTLHRAGTVLIRTRMARLGKVSNAAFLPAVQLRTPGGLITAFSFHGTGLAEGIYVESGDGENLQLCPGATVTIRRPHPAVELALPRTCLGQPSWVRTRSVTIWGTGTPPRTEDPTYIDVAPGHGTRLRHALSKRAYAPTGAVVTNRTSISVRPRTPGSEVLRFLHALDQR